MRVPSRSDWAVLFVSALLGGAVWVLFLGLAAHDYSLPASDPDAGRTIFGWRALAVDIEYSASGVGESYSRKWNLAAVPLYASAALAFHFGWRRPDLGMYFGATVLLVSWLLYFPTVPTSEGGHLLMGPGGSISKSHPDDNSCIDRGSLPSKAGKECRFKSVAAAMYTGVARWLACRSSSGRVQARV